MGFAPGEGQAVGRSQDAGGLGRGRLEPHWLCSPPAVPWCSLHSGPNDPTPGAKLRAGHVAGEQRCGIRDHLPWHGSPGPQGQPDPPTYAGGLQPPPGMSWGVPIKGAGLGWSLPFLPVRRKLHR